MTASVRGFAAASADDIAALDIPWLCERRSARAWETPGVELALVHGSALVDDAPTSVLHVAGWGMTADVSERLAATLSQAVSAVSGGWCALWGGDDRRPDGLLSICLAGTSVERTRADNEAWGGLLESTAGIQRMDVDAGRVSRSARRVLFDVTADPSAPSLAMRRAWFFARPEDLPTPPAGARLLSRTTPLRQQDFDVSTFPFVVVDGLDLDAVDALAMAANATAIAAMLPERLGGRWERGTRAPDVALPDAAALVTLQRGLCRTLECWPVALR